MSKYKSYEVIGYTSCFFVDYNNGNTKPNEKTEISKQINQQGVMVYYFHFSCRCAICNVVEDFTHKFIESDYSGRVIFKSLNIEDGEAEELVKKS